MLRRLNCGALRCSLQRRQAATQVLRGNTSSLVQGCQTSGLLGATLHVGNRAEGRMMFSIWRSPLLRATVSIMQPAARSISQKKVITSPASPHHRPSSGFVNQKSSSMARSVVNLQIIKSLYLSSVACVKGFKRFFEDETLQYCRNS